MSKKILVIRFSSIGDIVLTSPILRCLKSQLGDSEIHFLTKSKFKSLVEFDPHVDKIFGLSSSLEEIIPALKKENYDFVVDLHNNFRSRWIRFRLGKPGASFPKLNTLKWIWVHLKTNRMPSNHIVDRYFKATEKLGIQNDGNGLSFYPCSCEQPDSTQIPKLFQDGGFTLFSIGGTHFTKRMPVKKWIELFPLAKSPICIIGGVEDRETGDFIEKAGLKAGIAIWNSCGQFSIGGSAWLIQKSCLVFTHDTGMMHIAAAYKKPVVAIWGNTSPQLGMYPYQTPHFNMEVANLSCRPCSKIGFDKCPKDHFKCMNDQNTKNPFLVDFLANIPK
jgi:ADP-heptose:LPS heptosyltransferase